MTLFERNLEILLSHLISCEGDMRMGYRAYRLKDEDQVRIFRLPRGLSFAANDAPLPNKGLFVAAAMHPELGQLCLVYCSFPKDGSESIRHAALAYDMRELSKGQKHISNWFRFGMIPFADEEFAA